MSMTQLFTKLIFFATSVLLLSVVGKGIYQHYFPNATPQKRERGFDQAIARAQRMKQHQDNHTYSLNDVFVAQKAADQQLQLRDACVASLAWQDLGPNNVGGRSRTLLVDRNNTNRLYAGSVAGGIWISDDAGMNWHRYAGSDTMTTLSISHIVQGIDGTIYVGTGEYYENGYAYGLDASKVPGYGMYRSTDGGQTFHFLEATRPNNYDAQPNNYDWAFVNALAVDPTNANRLYAATQRGVWVSNDKGLTWQRPAGLSGTALAWDIQVAPNGKVYTAYSNGIYVSENGGSFVNISNNLAGNVPYTGSRRKIAVSPSDANYVYVVTTNSGCIDHVYQSSNGGQLWIEIGEGDDFFSPCSSYCQCWYDLTVAVNPYNPQNIYLGGVTLWAWHGEIGWSQIDNLDENAANPYYVHADKHGITFDSNTPNRAYIACDGGIFRSNNAGSYEPHFLEVNKGYNVTQFYSMSAGYEGNVIAGAQDNGTQLINYNFNSIATSREVMGGDGGYCEISHINPNIVFAEYQEGYMSRSVSGGDGFASFFDENIDEDHDGAPDAGAPFITPFFLWENEQRYFNGDGVVDAKFFTGDNARRIWMVSEPLTTSIIPEWKIIGTFTNGELASLCANSTGNTVFATSTNGKCMRLNNLNSTLVKKDLNDSMFQNRFLSGVAVESGDPNKLVVVAGNYGNDDYVFFSQNAMSNTPTFVSLQHNLPKMPVYDVVINPANPDYYLIIGTELGVWSYSLNQQCWTEQNVGVGRVPVYRVRLQNMRTVGCEVLYIGTHGRGMLRSTSLTYEGCDTHIAFENVVGQNAITSNHLDLKVVPTILQQQATVQYHLPDNVMQGQLQVYNAQGGLVYQQNIRSNEPQISLLRSNFPASGLYFVTIVANNRSKVVKILVQ